MYTQLETTHPASETSYAAGHAPDAPASFRNRELARRYSIQSLLGEGANGKTWLAQNRVDKSLVAVKELKIGTGFKSLELFEREAETLKSVNIEGVPKFYGYYADGDQQHCYIVQEYVPYPSIQTMLDRGDVFGEEETIAIMEKIARILHALQTQYVPPIIHRDIKPSNILYDRQTKQVCLIDFGAVANPQRKSLGSTVAGTQGFMAPEQLIGDCAIQSDYYALGASALYMLTGISPVDYECDPNDPFRLRFRDALNERNISAHLVDVIDKLLATHAEQRPASAQAVIELLSDRNVEMMNTLERIKKEYRNPGMLKFKRSLFRFGHALNNKLYKVFVVLTLLAMYASLSVDRASNLAIPIILTILFGALFFIVMKLRKWCEKKYDEYLSVILTMDAVKRDQKLKEDDGISTERKKYIVRNVKFSSPINDYIFESTFINGEGESYFRYFTQNMLKRDEWNNRALYFSDDSKRLIDAKCYVDEDSYNACMKDIELRTERQYATRAQSN